MERGDPQLVAIPIFVTGSIALGFQLVEYVSPAALGVGRHSRPGWRGHPRP